MKIDQNKTRLERLVGKIVVVKTKGRIPLTLEGTVRKRDDGSYMLCNAFLSTHSHFSAVDLEGGDLILYERESIKYRK
jgi:hypothetical protein